MRTLNEIRDALRQLTANQRMMIDLWLRELDGIPPPTDEVREARLAYGSPDPTYMTLEEFFEFEKNSPLRHEFVNGVIFAMNGASMNHSRINRNLVVAIDAHLKRGPCEVFPAGLKAVIQQGKNEMVYYPDIIIDCRPDTRDSHYVRDPKLLIEVLSPSTQLIDRREKLQNYRLIHSIEEYVIVAQAEWCVTVYSRDERWKPRVYDSLDAAVELRSIDLTIPLIEVYADIVPFT